MDVAILARVKRAVCYLRKSREDEQAERRGEDTLAAQREMMEREVLARYAFPCDVCEEVASGDSIRDRPVFRALLKKLGVEYQAIVIKDLSRLGRGSYSDMGVVYDLIRDRQIPIVTKDAVYDPGNHSDLMMIRFFMFISREEYEMITWRMREGKASLSRQGKWVAGSVPYGYRYDQERRVLIPEPNEARVVQLIFSLYAEQKLGARAIADTLKSLGIASPRGFADWRPGVIHRMLQKEVYRGTLLYRKTKRSKADQRRLAAPPAERIVVPNAHSPLIEESLWARVALRRGIKNKSATRKDGTPAAGAEARELAHMVRCGLCGRFLQYQMNRRAYLQMNGEATEHTNEYLRCFHCRIGARYRAVERQIIEVLRDVGAVDLAKRENEAIVSGDKALHKDVRHEEFELRVAARKMELERRMRRARAYLLDGTLTKEEYEQEKQELTAALHALEHLCTDAKAGRMSRVVTHSCAGADAAVPLCATLAEVYCRLPSADEKQRLLHSVFCDAILFVKDGGRTRDPFQLKLYLTHAFQNALVL